MRISLDGLGTGLGTYGSEGLGAAGSRATALRFAWIVLGEVPVMAAQGDEIAAEAGRRGHLRASHADREQVIDTLKAAFVQGMLAKDEFDLRVDQALADRTGAELSALTADIPAGLITAEPPTPVRAQGEQPVLRPGPVITAATAVYAGVWAYELFLSPHGGDNHSTPLLIFNGFFVYLIILAICVGRMVALRREKRSIGQSPRRPVAGAGGQASPALAISRPGWEASAGRSRPPAHSRSSTKASSSPAIAGSRSRRRWRPCGGTAQASW
jgi:hypothetical protein